MTNERLRTLGTTRLRSSPCLDILLLEQLEPSSRDALVGIEDDPDLYGFLCPRDGTSSVRTISREAALLFLTLRAPGPLPGYFRKLFADRADAMVAALVLDGILEVEHGGQFISGAAAHARLFEPSSHRSPAGGAIAQLSTDALKYAQAIGLDEAPRLSARLYFYNRTPASPRWRRQFPSRDAVGAYLQIDSGTELRARIDRTWNEAEAQPSLEGWRLWSARRRRTEGPLAFKLYVSPRAEHVQETFRAATDLFARQQVPRFKVGADIYGMLRPDKLVAYLESADEVMELGHRLMSKLKGIPAHGVPFTSEIAGDGLISWGMDPPREEHALPWQERTSWRLWLTNRLASALVSARAEPAKDLEPWEFAVERVRLEGVDPNTWTPRHSLFGIHPSVLG